MDKQKPSIEEGERTQRYKQFVFSLLRFTVSVYTFVFSLLLRLMVSVYIFVFPLLLRLTASVYTFVFSVLLRFTASVYTFVFSLVWFTASVYTVVFSVLLRCTASVYTFVFSLLRFTASVYTFVVSLLLRFTASVYTFGIFTLFLLLQSLYGIKIHIPKIIHKSSRYIPELTGSKSDPLKPYTIAMDTDWNINNLKHFFHVITIFFCKIKINRHFYILFYINHATIWPKCC
jgi:hypothetical protein